MREFSVRSTATFEEFENEFREQFNEPEDPLLLSYKVSWDGTKATRTVLESTRAWEKLVDIVTAKLRGRSQMKKSYHVELFSPLYERSANSKDKKKVVGGAKVCFSGESHYPGLNLCKG